MAQAHAVFGDPRLASLWLEKSIWNDDRIICPKCGGDRIKRTNERKSPYRCRVTKCRHRFSLKIGSPMEAQTFPSIIG